MGGAAPPDATRLGKYTVLTTLGSGGMATVYLAFADDPRGSPKLVVVKRLRPGLAYQPAMRTMFLDEARLAARMNHGNVVKTFEVGEDGDNLFIAMEYLDGQPLSRVVRLARDRREELPLGFVLQVAADALSGLQYAHDLEGDDGAPLGIVHRDVSPENVFVTYDGAVKIVDFGLAKATSSSVKTAMGVLKGKVRYMSPEQAEEKPLDRRTDVFSFGIVLWEMLTLKRLIPGDTTARSLFHLLNGPFAPPSEAGGPADRRLDAIVMRALARDRDERPATAALLREDIERYALEAGVLMRQEDVGAFLSERFSDVRRAEQRAIGAQVAAREAAARADAPAEGDAVAPGPPVAAEPARPGGTPAASPPGAGAPGDAGATAALRAPVPPRRRRGALAVWPWLLVLAALAVLGAAVHVAAKRHGHATKRLELE